jgi:octaprenyl-diphosphate synthase
LVGAKENREHHQKPKKVAEVIAFVKASGGIEYATEAMKRFQNEAFNILNTFPDSEYKTSLNQLVEYTIQRAK